MSGLNKVQSRLGRMHKGMVTTGKSMTKYVTAPIVAGGVLAVRAFEESEVAGAALERQVKASGGAANASTKHIMGMATSIQAYSGFSDEAVQNSARLILTFRNIRNEAGKGNKIFDRVVKGTTDFARQFTKGDMQQAAKMLGKAFDDPVRGATALRRAGVSLSEQQQKHLATMVDHNNMLGAQKLLLKILRPQIEGQAKAYGKTSEGMRAIKKQQLGDAMEKIGQVISAFVNPAIMKLGEWAGKAADWFNNLSKSGKDTAVKWLAMAAAAGPVLIILGKLVGIGRGVIGVLGSIGGAFLKVGTHAATAGAQATTGMGNAASGVSRLGSVIAGAGVAAGIALIGAVIVDQMKKDAEYRDLLSQVAAKTLKVADAQKVLAQRFHDVNEGGLLGKAVEGWKEVLPWVDSVTERYNKFADDAVQAVNKKVSELTSRWSTLLGMPAIGPLLPGGGLQSLREYITLLARSPKVTEEAGNSITNLMAHFQGLDGRVADIDMTYLNYLTSHGMIAEATKYLTGLVKNQGDAFGNMLPKGIKGARKAMATWNETILASQRLSVGERVSLSNKIASTYKYGVALKGTERKLLAAAIRAGDFATANKILDRALGRVQEKAKKGINLKVVAKGLNTTVAGLKKIYALDAQLRANPELILHYRYQRDGPPPTSTGHSGGRVTPTGIYHRGGLARRLHSGGRNVGPGELPAILQVGEFVIQKRAARKLGPLLPYLNRMHQGGAAMPRARTNAGSGGGGGTNGLIGLRVAGEVDDSGHFEGRVIDVLTDPANADLISGQVSRSARRRRPT